ncbi:MAG: bifunctional diaminohydroxyphosphoribosylaminopyrimidine deaminase/5-amino-6-(5-phosphoribosylamino)uracil reductase RibD [Chitinophagales bacterium]|nr:bifunctional diaminohydroxyphosphoribosylaminopyrimidine deaminase/5-amino-6-(5-phosphoribosylamino)uracil reductase RibD [Chitinophagales bacterium]
MNTDEIYIQRCLALAKLGNGYVAPNPMVGSVLVYNNEIIGEGYHQKFGEAHAEVNCINSVSKKNQEKIKNASLYVSLEPCNHFGKTPPCTNLIVEKKIKRVVIGCQDFFNQVNGKGIEFLKSKNIDVVTNVLEEECINLNKRFFLFHQKQRPFIILKFAQAANKKIAYKTNDRLFISNDITNKLVHKWRSEESAILIGTNTALQDDPYLTNRNYSGKSPIRLVIDKQLCLPKSLNIFNTDTTTIIFNTKISEELENIKFVKLNESFSVIQQILNYCYQHQIMSILVEGGAKLLQSFIDEQIWDEARIITNTSLIIKEGINAPNFYGRKIKTENILSDNISYYLPA